MFFFSLKKIEKIINKYVNEKYFSKSSFRYDEVFYELSYDLVDINSTYVNIDTILKSLSTFTSSLSSLSSLSKIFKIKVVLQKEKKETLSLSFISYIDIISENGSVTYGGYLWRGEIVEERVRITAFLSVEGPVIHESAYGSGCKFLREKENKKISTIVKLNVTLMLRFRFLIFLILLLSLSERHLMTVLELSLKNDIESNPGPNRLNGVLPVTDGKNLFICTYNVQGLLYYPKLKRLKKFLNSIPFRGSSIICLQETHFKQNNLIKDLWSHGHTQSYCCNGTGGTAILFNENYFDNIIRMDNDLQGRWSMITLSKDERIYTIVNIYAPNNNVNY